MLNTTWYWQKNCIIYCLSKNNSWINLMENSVFITISKSKKSIAIAFLSFVLAAVSGFIVIKISQWNKMQAGIILSLARERQAKSIWQQIAQYGLPPAQMIANNRYMASFSAGLDELVAIGLTGKNRWASKYKVQGTSFNFDVLRGIHDIKAPIYIKS